MENDYFYIGCDYVNEEEDYMVITIMTNPDKEYYTITYSLIIDPYALLN